MITRKIPSTKEALPVIGLGTWQTFDVSANSNSESLKQVLKIMNDSGGKVIDTSPMYGRSEENIGRLLSGSGIENDFFYASKVWTRGQKEGIQQMESSFTKLKRSSIDLMQIHNLVDWKTHLKTMQKWKEEGKIRYIGITHYQDSMHSELEQILTNEKVDFVQFNYSIFSRNAENRLLPAAADKGVATLINRPFGEGAAFERTKGKQIPDWAKEYNILTWGQFFLKFIISHAAVTCVIPATGNPEHASDNMKSGEGKLPDKTAREKMVAYIK